MSVVGMVPRTGAGGTSAAVAAARARARARARVLVSGCLWVCGYGSTFTSSGVGKRVSESENLQGASSSKLCCRLPTPALGPHLAAPVKSSWR